MVTKVEVFNNDTNEYETFQLVSDGELEFKDDESEELTDSDIYKINLWLFVKNKFNISDGAWHEIATKANNVVKICSMKKRISKLNSM